jgi:hypothetical protein
MSDTTQSFGGNNKILIAAYKLATSVKAKDISIKDKARKPKGLKHGIYFEANRWIATHSTLGMVCFESEPPEIVRLNLTNNYIGE